MRGGEGHARWSNAKNQSVSPDSALSNTGNRDGGSQKIAFSNFVRQVMLTDLRDAPGNPSAGRWISYATYDPTCACVTACYLPSAINMGAKPD